ncbi:CTA9 [Candida jiufengensis]|uniref:CTA9 n=1 Tax=Candida jiufengensis TaxID=497108 RepID=UPI0022242652|nr:CTA9 [Candida jiufengensis]KAI5955709.1 CTA9 [Candida jiufengensis]
MTFKFDNQQSRIMESNEKIKPNFIHSSDIPKKLANLVYSIIKSKYKNTNKKCQISLNLNLNSLVSRGSTNLITSLNKKMISIVQSSTNNSNYLSNQLIIRQNYQSSNYLKDIITEKIKVNKQIYPYALTTNDTFIIKFKLVIDQIDEEELEFEDDEQYQILKSFDLHNSNIIQDLKNYILYIYKTLSEDLNKENDQNDNHNILLDMSDSTLEYDEISSDEYENYKIDSLISNETLIDEFKRRFSDVSIEEKSFNLKSNIFINNLSNLRHNDDDDEHLITEEIKISSGEEEQQQAVSITHSSRQSPITPTDLHIHLDDLIEVSFEENDDDDNYFDDVEIRNSPKKLISSSPIKDSQSYKFEFTDPKESKLTNQHSLQSFSPTKERKSISRMSSSHSVSMINTDEKYGLEYAYNSDSSVVPTYIKQNKKFKFIKVGKVQKFVDLFEDGGVYNKK